MIGGNSNIINKIYIFNYNYIFNLLNNNLSGTLVVLPLIFG